SDLDFDKSQALCKIQKKKINSIERTNESKIGRQELVKSADNVKTSDSVQENCGKRSLKDGLGLIRIIKEKSKDLKTDNVDAKDIVPIDNLIMMLRADRIFHKSTNKLQANERCDLIERCEEELMKCKSHGDNAKAYFDYNKLI
ncbi:MAG: hypothetical protein MHMPM18_002184, partial [Marteilia pararefringens]